MDIRTTRDDSNVDINRQSRKLENTLRLYGSAREQYERTISIRDKTPISSQNENLCSPSMADEYENIYHYEKSNGTYSGFKANINSYYIEENTRYEGSKPTKNFKNSTEDKIFGGHLQSGSSESSGRNSKGEHRPTNVFTKNLTPSQRYQRWKDIASSKHLQKHPKQARQNEVLIEKIILCSPSVSDNSDKSYYYAKSSGTCANSSGSEAKNNSYYFDFGYGEGSKPTKNFKNSTEDKIFLGHLQSGSSESFGQNSKRESSSQLDEQSVDICGCFNWCSSKNKSDKKSPIKPDDSENSYYYKKSSRTYSIHTNSSTTKDKIFWGQNSKSEHSRDKNLMPSQRYKRIKLSIDLFIKK